MDNAGYPGGYDGRRLAPAGGYTSAGAEATEGGGSCFFPLAGSASSSVGAAAAAGLPFGGAQQAQPVASSPAGLLFAGGASMATQPVPVTPAATVAAASFPQPPMASLSSFGSFNTSASGGSSRKRKCSGDGVESCGSCGHRLMAQRVVDGLSCPEVSGYCNSCVCRCALCGRAVVRTSTVSTILDEPLLLTARELGVPIEDSFSMGQDIGLMALVCEDSCIKRLQRMRRMMKRKNSSGLRRNASSSGDDGMDLG